MKILIYIIKKKIFFYFFFFLISPVSFGSHHGQCYYKEWKNQKHWQQWTVRVEQGEWLWHPTNLRKQISWNCGQQLPVKLSFHYSKKHHNVVVISKESIWGLTGDCHCVNDNLIMIWHTSLGGGGLEINVSHWGTQNDDYSNKALN